MASLSILAIILSVVMLVMLTSAAPAPGIHIHSAAYEVHPPVVHHVPVYHETYHPYHAPVVAPAVYHAPVIHPAPYHPYVQPVAYKVKTHYHLFGK